MISTAQRNAGHKATVCVLQLTSERWVKNSSKVSLTHRIIDRQPTVFSIYISVGLSMNGFA